MGGSQTSKDICSTICGDTFIVGSENCEDGNTVSGDGCSEFCQEEKGFERTDYQVFSIDPPSGKTHHHFICGDLFKTHLEACDDGN